MGIDEQIINNEIFNLRLKGLSYEKIRQELIKKYDVAVALKTISIKCSIMFKERDIEEPNLGRGRKNKWNVGEEAQELNNKIFELKEHGYNSAEITQILNERGINISRDKVGRLIRKIYAEQGKSVPKSVNLSNIDNNEIYDLTIKGYKIEDILAYLKDKNIIIPEKVLKDLIREIYAERGIEKKGGRRTIEIPEEEAYAMKKSGMTLSEITKYYQSKGIKIKESALYRKIAAIYEKKGEILTRVPTTVTTIRKALPEEQEQLIYKLKEDKKSVNEIAQILHDEYGIDLSFYLIRKHVSKIYKEMGKEVPQAKMGRKRKYEEDVKRDISEFDDIIYSLRENGLNSRAIREELLQKYGYKTAMAKIDRRIKVIYEGKKQDIPKPTKQTRIKKKVCELREQGLKYAEIADELKKHGTKVNVYTIERICRVVYGRTSAKKIKQMAELRKLEAEKVILNEKKNKSDELLAEYKQLEAANEKDQGERDE